MKIAKILLCISSISLLVPLNLYAQKQHPNLLLNKKDIQEIKTSLGKYPVFDKAYQKPL